MAHLTKPTKYDIEDSNIALLGSEVRIHVSKSLFENDNLNTFSLRRTFVNTQATKKQLGKTLDAESG
jgi:hypothetical protein